MPGSRLPLALLAPVSLLVLVVALGALQYRWVGQVSEAEREQLRQSLDRRSREFADDFDREIGRAYERFRPGQTLTPAEPERFNQQFDEWRSTARFPGLVKTAYIAMQSGSDVALYRYAPDTRTFAAIEWPQSLASVHTRLLATTAHLPAAAAGVPGGAGAGGIGAGNVMIAAVPVMPDVPALVIGEQPSMSTIPDALRMNGMSTTFKFEVAQPRNFLVLELDRDYLASTVLNALAELHFPESGADRFRLEVVDNRARVVMARGLRDGQTLDLAKSDATAPFFGLRLETMKINAAARGTQGTQSTQSTFVITTGTPTLRAVTPAEGPRSGAVVVPKPVDQTDKLAKMMIEQHATTVAAAAGRATSAGWTLVLQHSAGSLDAAVDRARHRNLWLSFGILSVLAASAGLVLVNARRSEKLAAQQLDFVATVSHELRTPVAVIRSAAQNLAAGVVHDPEQAKRYGDLIEAEGRRLTDMVEQVLEYAGLSDAKRQRAARPVDAGLLARDVVSASESLPEADRVTFEVRIDDGAPAVMADEDALRRALLNLVGNALKYGADGGWIGVTVTRGSGKDDGYVAISVADRGRGIPPEDLAHIFTPFYRGAYARDRQIHGNGLGLSLVKRIVEAHHGRVSVRSAPNEGATFTLLLPYAAEAAAGTPARVTAIGDSAQPIEGRSA